MRFPSVFVVLCGVLFWHKYFMYPFGSLTICHNRRFPLKIFFRKWCVALCVFAEHVRYCVPSLPF